MVSVNKDALLNHLADIIQKLDSKNDVCLSVLQVYPNDDKRLNRYHSIDFKHQIATAFYEEVAEWSTDLEPDEISTDVEIHYGTCINHDTITLRAYLHGTCLDCDISLTRFVYDEQFKVWKCAVDSEDVIVLYLIPQTGNDWK